MGESKRLAGLELLRAFGLPTPPWRVVRVPDDVRQLNFPPVAFGWTVRTCRTDDHPEVGGYFVNHATPEEARVILFERLGRYAPAEFYIVYPSWEFAMSFNIILDASAYVFEGKYGSQKELSSGRDSPDVSVIIPYGLRTRQTAQVGQDGQFVDRQIGRLLTLLRRLPLDRYYTEVAITSEDKVVFYEFFGIG